MLKHTDGKTTTSKAPKTFFLQRCQNSVVCPVRGLEAYVSGAKALGVDLRVGYVFRMVSEGGDVMASPITYDVAYDRLKKYLDVLGIYEGETPHSLKGGCAVTMHLTGAAQGIEDLQDHVGWRSRGMPVRYARIKSSHNMGVSQRLREAIDEQSQVSARDVAALYEGVSYDTLPLAFN